ncbi:MAG TPA: phage tail tape measure protein, partial [Chromatiales bacterium]|nr:phage tail tape measure protein [Chromatiales bacterium]
MATIDKTVEIIFSGKDDVSRVMRGIRGGLSDLEGVAEAVARPLAQVANAVLAADATLAGLAAGGLALAIRAAGEFQQGFGEISTLIDASEDDLADFEQAVRQYAATSTQSWDEVQQAVYNAISAGVDYRHSLDLVAQAEKLAVAGRANLNDTTVLLVSTMNAYGASTDEAARYSDILFQTVRQGQTTIPQLAQSLAQVTGTAAGASVPFEEIAAAIATLTAAGLPTSQAITAIKAALSNILKPASQATKLAGELGIQFDAAALKSKGFSGVLADVARATGGNVDKLGQLFGSVEALNGVLILAGTGADAFRANLEAMGQSAGSTQTAFEKMAGNVDLAMQRVKNAAFSALSQIGQPFIDEFNNIADAISAVFAAVGQSFDAGSFDPLIQVVEDAARAIDSLLDDIAANLPQALEQIDWSPITDNLRNLGDALSQIFGGLDLSTTE